MTAKKEVEKSEISESVVQANTEKKKCFVIMPIADQPGYPDGHFSRVYLELIKPAVEDAGFSPERADDSINTKVIILSILKAITEYDMAICDLSSLNPNVMYELGIRQMAKMPVTLIKDKETRRIFDTGLMSDVPYDSSLRVDLVRDARKRIAASLISTYNERDSSANSLLKLLGTQLKIDETTVVVSSGEKVILDQLQHILSILPSNYNINKNIIRMEVKQDVVLKDTNGWDIEVNTILTYMYSSNSDRPIYYIVKGIEHDNYESGNFYTIYMGDLTNSKTETLLSETDVLTGLVVVKLSELKRNDPEQYATYMRLVKTPYL